MAWDKIEITHRPEQGGTNCQWKWKNGCEGPFDWEVKRWSPGAKKPLIAWACEVHAKQWMGMLYKTLDTNI